MTLTLEQARALVFIGAYRHKHGVSPTWGEIARAMSWHHGRDRGELHVSGFLWTLRRQRLVAFDAEPRTVRLRGKAAKLALERLRSG